ncbi:MAG: Rieske (2Fe-2S) protein [Pseudomonadota bacterium]
MAVAVCKASDLPVGSHKEFAVNGETVLVFHLDDGFYATQNRCTHLFMSLKKGKLIDGCKIQCPFHRAQFDVRTGAVACWANFPPGVQMLNVVRGEKPLKTFATSVVNGEVFVEVG